TECQSSLLEECLNSRPGMGFQCFPAWGRYYKVISVANNRYAFIDAPAFGWWSWPSIGVFRVEQPFHPIQWHVWQQWGDDSSLRCACVCGREEADFDDSCFQPVAHRGGEYGQLGQQWSVVNVVKASADVRIEHPWTTILTVHSRIDGFD